MMAKQKSHFVAMSATRRMIYDLSSVSKSRLLDVYTGHLMSRAYVGFFLTRVALATMAVCCQPPHLCSARLRLRISHDEARW